MDDKLDYGPLNGEIPDRLEEDAKIKTVVGTRASPVRFTKARKIVSHKHLPWYTYALTACWTYHKQFGQIKLLENHCLQIHNCYI